MKKVKLLLTISIISLIISTLFCGVGLTARAENEITITSMTAVNYIGETVSYDGTTYARDITLNYAFNDAYYYLVNVYVKEGNSYNLYLSTPQVIVEEGKGSYLVNTDGDLMIECVAKNYAEFVIGTLSTYVLSDVTAPATPSIDVDGVMDVAHSTPFSVTYSVNYDNLSGVDFTHSFYRYENEEGEVVINTTYLNESIGYNQASISGIACKGTLIFTIFDKAGNFVEVEKSYTKHLYVESVAPRINVSPETGYSQNVMVTIVWPEGVSTKYYRVITAQSIGTKKQYTAPFGITSEKWEGGIVAEGEVTIRAYYYKDGKETYVDKTINNVDTTPPNVSTVKESVKVKVDLKQEDPVTLTLRAFDAKSGIKKVYLKYFGTEFKLQGGVNTYSLNVTNRLDSTIVIVMEDNAGNRSEYTYALTGFDKDRILSYSQKFKMIDPAEYDAFGYSELLTQYDRLSNLLSSADSQTNDILSYSQALDRAIDGKYDIEFKLLSSIGGFAADFSFDIPKNATSVGLGGRLYFEGGKVNLPQNKLDENISVVGTISKYLNYDVYPFNLTVKNDDGTIINLNKQINVTITIPSNRIAKIYYNDNGVLTQLSSEINNGKITFTTSGLGDFYLVVDKKVEEDRGPGLMIGDKFFPQNVLLIAGGIILGSLVLVGVLTPIIVKLSKNRKSKRSAFRYFR